MQYHVYAVGNALVDMEYEVTESFLAEHNIDKAVMTLVDQHQQAALIAALHKHPVKHSCGGSAANTLIAAQRFGCRCYFTGKVSDDKPGVLYAKDLESIGIDSNIQSNALESALPSGQCLVMITPDAERTMHTFLGAADQVGAQEVNAEAIKASEYVYIEGYLAASEKSRHAAIRTRELAQTCGTKVAMTLSDPNMVEYFKPSLEQMSGTTLDLLFCNEKEAKIWASTDELSQAQEALKQKAKNFVITLGDKGALIYDGHQTHTLPGQPVKAKDTNGAGDMFAGAFLYAITHGHNHISAGRLAIAASAKLVTEFGPRLSLNQHQQLIEAWGSLESA